MRKGKCWNQLEEDRLHFTQGLSCQVKEFGLHLKASDEGFQVEKQCELCAILEGI
jgi:hypothetical protein